MKCTNWITHSLLHFTPVAKDVGKALNLTKDVGKALNCLPLSQEKEFMPNHLKGFVLRLDGILAINIGLFS